MIPFIKAHACGNDFLIVKEEDVEGYDQAALAQRLCRRNTGVGADGVEFLAWTGNASARIKLYNADGSIAEISGNGTRCVAAWMADESNAQVGDEVSIETDAGVRTCRLNDFRNSENSGPTLFITTDMDVPEYEEKTIELADGTEITGVYVSMGNPHFVIPVGHEGSDPPAYLTEDRTWEEVGEEICLHPDFEEQTNVEFVRTHGSTSEPLRKVSISIFERGVGPTASSGTGTSATATAMIAFHGALSPLEVFAEGGVQTVEWAGPGEKLYLTGPATLIARGEAW